MNVKRLDSDEYLVLWDKLVQGLSVPTPLLSGTASFSSRDLDRRVFNALWGFRRDPGVTRRGHFGYDVGFWKVGVVASSTSLLNLCAS